MAETTALPPRHAVEEKYKWNAPSVFESVAQWEAKFSATQKAIECLADDYQGKLHASPGTLVNCLETLYNLVADAVTLRMYANMESAADTNDQAAAALNGRGMSLMSALQAATAFVEPEIIAIGQDTINTWLQTEADLAIYAHYFDDLFRKQAHVRSAEVEELLGMVGDPFGSLYQTAQMLCNADLKFAPATTADGQQLSVEQGNILSHMLSADRERRRTAGQSFRDGYLSMKNTLASNLSAAIKRDVFYARARRHDSSLAASLDESNIPVEVFHNLIDTYRANLPTWHRYWSIRRQILGVDVPPAGPGCVAIAN